MKTFEQFGAGFAPAWHRPWFRYFAPVEGEGGGSEDDDDGDGAGDNAGTGDQDGDNDNPAGAEALGDPGKKALDAMKAKWKDAEKKAADADVARASLQAKIDGQEAEHTASLKDQQVHDAAMAAANLRIKKAQVQLAAKGKLSDPTDALTFIDLDDIEVDDEGNVDTTALDAAVDALLSKKPYLAAQGGRRFQGDGDGGARNGRQRPSQLTEAEVKKLSAEGRHAEIVKAREEGRLEDYLKS